MTRKSNSKKIYIFTLSGVDTEKIDLRFGIRIVSNIDELTSKRPQNTTKLSDLSNKQTPEIISFMDEAKQTHKCNVSMVDFLTNNQLDFDMSIYNCFWCKNTIPKNIIAIGCPIKYVPTQLIKTYYSEISKDTYTIKENITKKRIMDIMDMKDDRMTIVKKDYYITDGIFCSFNCCMAYIDDNKHISMYNMSEMLLLKMYNDIYPTKIPSIDKAPHWRKLNQFAGNLSITEFRNSFNNIEYTNHGLVSETPRFKSIGILFEEQIKF
jgi:hypothetical protein